MPTVGISYEKLETHVTLHEDFILVRLDPPIARTKGGIEIPGTVKPSSRTGLVVQRGPGKLSDDGRTRMPTTCDVGHRILFEVGAGDFLPMVPRETTPTGWGYKLIRDGSVIATVAGAGEDEDSDAELPPPNGPVPVSIRGRYDVPGWADRLEPVQDWLLVRMDERQSEHVVRSGPRLVDLSGRPLRIHLGPDRDQERREDTWTVQVLKRGPGLNTITRCLDGDRLGRAPHIVKVGDRAIAKGTAPNAQPIDMDEEWSAPGRVLMLREYPCIRGVILPGAEPSAA